MFYKILKRFFDIIFSVLGIIVTSPILILTAVLIKLESKGPALFLQNRIGKSGIVFKIYKFRSMYLDSEKAGVYSDKNDKRITKIGRFIRSTSIDELPQLFNIFSGKMSFIGPRPVLTYHPWSYEQYTPTQLQRFAVRPGITGWAQINGRKEIMWDKRIELDCEYIAKVSFLFDIKIVFLTIYKVLFNKNNANVTTTATVKTVVEADINKEMEKV